MPAPKDLLVSLPTQVASALSRRAFTTSLRVATFGLNQASNLLQRFAGGAAPETPAKVAPQAPVAYPVERPVEVAVDEFGAVGSLTDNTGVEPDGTKPPFPGFDTLSGDSVMRHVSGSTDLPDLQVLLAYEEAHKNRKGVVQAVEARLAQLGSPVS
ncbi:MAG: hypothetical protein JWP11_1789 [Frankiales bacterium]|nr:hypothetical protein [Frankiales bacterium]